MPKKNKPTTPDASSFRDAVKDVQPLIHNKIRLRRSITSSRSNPQPKFMGEVFDFTNATALGKHQADDFISYKQSIVSNKTLRNLRKGQYNIEATLDLHGLSVDQAHEAVKAFITTCLERHIQVGLIIHGKGSREQEIPILKNQLDHWLRHAPAVLAFCSAAQKHGSHGAVYILLNSSQEENHF